MPRLLLQSLEVLLCAVELRVQSDRLFQLGDCFLRAPLLLERQTEPPMCPGMRRAADLGLDSQVTTQECLRARGIGLLRDDGSRRLIVRAEIPRYRGLGATECRFELGPLLLLRLPNRQQCPSARAARLRLDRFARKALGFFGLAPRRNQPARER